MLSKKKRLPFNSLKYIIATGFGSGLIYPAPGTWGTLFGLILGILFIPYISYYICLLIIIVSFIVGCIICQKISDEQQVHDHSSIVWDEIVAIWLVLLYLPNLSLVNCISAFILFRLFDITKPWPVSYFDRKIDNGFGVMFDDIVAALYSILSYYLICYFYSLV